MSGSDLKSLGRLIKGIWGDGRTVVVGKEKK